MSLSNLNHKSFSEQFLEKYLESGFGSLPKKEIDLLILELLIANNPLWVGTDKPNAFSIAKLLKVKKSRVRSLLDELSYRNLDEEKAKRILLDIISSAEKNVDKDNITIQIEDNYVREYAKDIVHRNYGMTDTSFDRTRIVLSGKQLLALVAEIANPEITKRLQEEIKKIQKENNSNFEIKSFVSDVVSGTISGVASGWVSFTMGILQP